MPSHDTRFQSGTAATALAIVFLILCFFALFGLFFLAGMTERDIEHVYRGLRRLFREGGAGAWAVAFFHVVAVAALGCLGFFSIRGKRIPSAALLLPAFLPFFAGVLGTVLAVTHLFRAYGFTDTEYRATLLAEGFAESLVPAHLGALSSGMVFLGVMTAGAFGLAGLHLPARAGRRGAAIGASAGAGVILIGAGIAIRAFFGLRPDAGDLVLWCGLISASLCGGIASLALSSIAAHPDPEAAGSIWRKGGMMAAAGGLGLALLGLAELLHVQRHAFSGLGAVAPDTLALVMARASAEVQSSRIAAVCLSVLGGTALAVPLLFSGPALSAGLRRLGPTFWITLAGVAVIGAGVVIVQTQIDRTGPSLMRSAAIEARRGPPTCETRVTVTDALGDEEEFAQKTKDLNDYRRLGPDELPTDRARCGRVTIRTDPDDARITVIQRRYRKDCTLASEDALESCVRGRPDYTTPIEERVIDNPTLHLDWSREESVPGLVLELPVRETDAERRVLDRLEYVIQVEREGYEPGTWYIPAEENRKAAEPMETISWVPSSPGSEDSRRVDWVEAKARLELIASIEGIRTAYREVRLMMRCTNWRIEQDRRKGVWIAPHAEASARDRILARYGCTSLEAWHEAVKEIEADDAFKAEVEQALMTVPCPEYPPRGFPVCRISNARALRHVGSLGVLEAWESEGTRGVQLLSRPVKIRGKVRPGTGVFVGYCDREAVLRAIQLRIVALRACYASRLIDHPGLSGKITIRWTIGLNGHVQHAEVVTDLLKDEKVSQCLLDRLQAFTFPTSPGGTCTVQIPFVFEVE